MQFSLALSFPVTTLQAIAVEASVATTSFRTDFDHGNGVGVQLLGDVLRVRECSTHRSNCIRMSTAEPAICGITLRKGISWIVAGS